MDGSPLDANDEMFTRSKDTSHVERFLRTHPLAKIIVIIDTHSLKNGFFAWTGNGKDIEFRACSLLEVGVLLYPVHSLSSPPPQILKDCTPKHVFQYLSNAEDMPNHHHKSLIMNLACGTSISEVRPRSEIFDG